MFTPFVTFNEKTHKFEVNQTDLKLQEDKPSISYVSIVDLKSDEFKAISDVQSLKFDEKNICGLFVSEIFTHENGKKFRYLYLPPLNNRLEQKYQDLFASICVTLSNVCIFGMSSKYTRLPKDTENLTKTWSRSNYIVLNSHGSELYNVKIQANKMQISTKIKIQSGQICPQQLIDNLQLQHNQCNVTDKLSNIFMKIISPKYLLNFQEIKTSFLFKIRVTQWLEQSSQQFNKLLQKQKKLSSSEIDQLTKHIQSFQIQQLKQILSRYLPSLKDQLIEQLFLINQQLTLNYLQQLKSQNFPSNLQQPEFIQQKQALSKTLVDYNINKKFINIVSSQQQILIANNKIYSLECTIANKNQQINTLNSAKSTLKQQIEKLTKKNTTLSEQNYNFREFNKAYEQICEQLNRQRQQTRKNKLQIQSLLIDQSNLISTQNRLEQIILRLKNQQNSMRDLIQSLIQTKTINEKQIQQLNYTIDGLQQQINKFSILEIEALQSIQKQKENTKKMLEYKRFSRQFMGNMEDFKDMEMEKINYILKRNYGRYLEVMRDKENAEEKCKVKDQEIQVLKAKNQEYQMIIQYCQQQTFQKLSSFSQKTCEQSNTTATTNKKWLNYQPEYPKQYRNHPNQIIA